MRRADVLAANGVDETPYRLLYLLVARTALTGARRLGAKASPSKGRANKVETMLMILMVDTISNLFLVYKIENSG
jgi:hypothetical protein